MLSIKTRILGIIAILTIMLALSLAGLAYAGPLATSTTVTFDGSGFSPETITVTVGSQVTWQNNTGEDHELQSQAATAVYLPLIVKDSNGQTSAPASAQAGVIPAGGSFGGPFPAGGTFSHTFTSAGTYGYFLTTAPQFTGRVIVVEGSSGGSATLHGIVRDTDGSRLADVQVSAPASGGSSGLTSIDGEVTVNNVPTGQPVLLQVSKTGYADQWVRLTIPSTFTQTTFETALLPRQSSSAVLNAENGFTVTGAGGAGLEVPANGLVDQNGDPVTGFILVTMTPLDVNSPEISGFPGDFEGVSGGGQPEPILSYGATEFILTQGGQPLQLAPGQQATIHLPLYVAAHQDGTPITPGDSIPLWSLDETNGLWKQEGTGQVLSSLQSPTVLVAQAEIEHFSWWNMDIPFDGPPFWIVPKCQIGGVDVACHIEATPVCAAPGSGGPVGACIRKANAPPVRTAVADIPAGNTEALPVPPARPIRVKATGVEGFDSTREYVIGSKGEIEEVILELAPTVIEPFVPGQATKMAIDPAHEIDRYTFIGQPDEHVFLDVRPAAGSNLGGMVKLDDPADTTLFNETFSTSAPAYGPTQLTLSGTYTITVDGTANEPGTYLLALRRQLPFDPTFGDQGIAEGSAGTTQIGEMVLQSDGKFVTVQNSGTVFRVRRFESNGAVDTGFGSSGLAELGSSQAQAAHDLALQTDGKIVVAAQRYAGSSNGRDNFVVVRLNANGSLDTTFGLSGTVELDSTDDDVLDQILVQPDGKIVAAGRADNTLTLIRLNTDGSLDTTFNGDGIVTDSRLTFPEAGLVRQSDGKLLVGGWTTAASGGANLDVGLIRFNSNGSLDTGFGTNGLVAAELGQDDYARALALQSDGTILVAGENGIGENPFVLAYTGGGSLNTDFGVNGKLTLEVSTDTAIKDIAIAADNKFAVAGTSESFIPGNTDDDFLLAWYEADGDPVSGAGEAGVSLIPIGRAGYSDDDDRASAVVIQPDGKIVVGGSTQIGGSTAVVLARFWP